MTAIESKDDEPFENKCDHCEKESWLQLDYWCACRRYCKDCWDGVTKEEKDALD